MKKNILGLSAIVLAIAFSAFNMPSKLTQAYIYNGPTSQTPSDRIDPNNYVQGSLSCDGSGNECGMVLEQTGTHPDFSGTKVTFDSNTGFANGGDDFVSNSQKD